MSFYFSSCKTIESLKLRYKHLIFQHHPDRSKKDSTSYLQIAAEYEYYISNPHLIGMTRAPLYSIEKSKSKNNIIFCLCGTKFEMHDLEREIIECDTCSHYIYLK